MKYAKLSGHEYSEEEIKQSIENTYYMAHEVVEDFEPDATVRLPDLVVPEGKDEDQALIELCFEGLKAKGLDKKKGRLFNPFWFCAIKRRWL